MWHGHELVFLSDRGSTGRLNLWAYDVQKKTTVAITDFSDADVRFPSIGPEDVVFEHAGKLHRYEFATSRTVALDIAIPGDRPTLRPQTLDLSNNIASVRVGPNAKRLVVEARGEIFSVPVEEGVTRNLTASDGVAERTPAWSPDGLWIAYASDRTGEYELYVRRADGQSFKWADQGELVPEHAITRIGAGWKYGPSWAPDSKSLAFCNNAGELWHVVLENGALKKLATNPQGDPFGVDWSRDSRWLTWSHRHSTSRLNALYLYDLSKGELHEMTSGRFDDREPTFDRDGDWLYFASSRTFEPIYSDFDETWIYTNASNLLAVALRKDVKSPFLVDDASESKPDKKGDDKKDEKGKDKSDDAKKDGDKSDSKKDDSKDDDKSDKDADKPPKPVEIELDGFESRILALPVDTGELSNLQGSKGKVFYLRNPRVGAGDGGSKAKGKKGGSELAMFDMHAERKEREEKTIVGGVRSYELAAKADKLLVATTDGDYFVIPPKPEQKLENKVDLSHVEATIDPRHEWDQILADAYRIMRDYFYEPSMHGSDWHAIYERFRGALGDATSRDDLHYLLGEMISELNIGHAYNSGGPGIPEAPPKGRAAGLVGCDWKLEQGAYRIAHILAGNPSEADARSPLAQPGVDAHEGDWLLAVNGAPVDANSDVYAAFLGTSDKEPVELTLNGAPIADGHERRVVVTAIPDEGGLRYRAWVEHNRALVDEMSKGRIAYVHVPDTGTRGQNELVRQFMGQFQKDALLVDERWNSGGQIPTRFIELLDRPVTNFWALRHGDDWVWPQVGHRGPKAMLINGSSGSGGDAFPYYFRQAQLGPLIGMRTWGGLVGLSGNPEFIDGSSITVPRFAFYEKDGTWGVEGYGVAPDIEVIDDPALMAHGEDPQLIAGVQNLLKQLENWKFDKPTRPGSPDRHNGGGVAPSDR
jgi:tricorn protease